MPAKKDQSEVNLDKEFDAGRRSISQTIAGLGAGALGVGMGGVVASAIWGLASANGINDAALSALLGNLSANWISTAVWELRERLRAKEAPNMNAEVARLAQEWQPQLTDARLGEILQKLGALDETLTALEKQGGSNDAILKELQRINNKAANSVRVKISNAQNSVILTASGDIVVNAPIQIQTIAQKSEVDVRIEKIQQEIAAYKRVVAHSVSNLDLRGFDIAIQATASGGAKKTGEMKLESVFTPVYTVVSYKDSTDRAKIISGTQDLRDFIKAESQWTGFEKVNCIAALSESPRAILLGAAGSGKSTVLNHLALGLCGKVEDFDRDWRHGGLLPIRIILRQFARFAKGEITHMPKTPEEKLAQAQFCAAWDAGDCSLLLEFARKQLRDENGRVLQWLSDSFAEWLEGNGGVWILDGLDEVPAEFRPKLDKMTQNLIKAYPRCRVVLACRPYSYDSPTLKGKIFAYGKPLDEFRVLPFEMPQVSHFVAKWYAQMPDFLDGALSNEMAHNRANMLVARIEKNDRLRKLAENPLLLTMMTSLHSAGNTELPEDRWLLIGQIVKLLLDVWQRRKSDDLPTDFDHKEQLIRENIVGAETHVMSALQELAYTVHADKSRALGKEDASDISEEELNRGLRRILDAAGLNRRIVSDEDLKMYLRDRAGIILDEGANTSQFADAPRKYRFPHRMFQEYLAAKHKENDIEDVIEALDGDFERWREVFALIALSGKPRETAECINKLCPDTPKTDTDWQKISLAIEIWQDKHPTSAEINAKSILPNILTLRNWLEQRLHGELGGTPAARAKAGRKLCQLPNPDPARFTCADHRHAVCANLRTPEGLAEYLQNGFVDVVWDKNFVMQRGERNAAPAPQFASFRMAKTPVTVAQFAAFVDGNGYDDDQFWNWSPNALRWLKNAGRKEPPYWNDPRFHHANSPVVGVTWYEAMAFCHWLTSKIRFCVPAPDPSQREGDIIDLPTELEWEFAARGSEGRDYAWKKGRWQKGDEQFCNMSETGIITTSPAGMFPNGATPEGVFDLSGNVWEWMRNEWDEDWKKAIRNIGIAGDSPRSLRGGAWYGNLDLARCAYRLTNSPDYGNLYRGFRVVLRA